MAAPAPTPHHARGAGQRASVLYALGANIAVAVAKGVAGLLGGSAAMIAEAAHSVADTADQGLLLISLRRGELPADGRHQVGYGRERFFWALLAAIFIFIGGAVFSIAEGVATLTVLPEEPERFRLAVAVLGLSLVAESVSFRRALREVGEGARRHRTSVRRYLRHSTDPTVRTVVFEDGAAIAGVLVALGAVTLHHLTGDAWWDAAGAIAVGLLLAVAAIALARDTKALLIGEAALPEEQRRLREVLTRQPEIAAVRSLVTTHIGPARLLVAARVTLAGDAGPAEIAALGPRVRESMRREVPDVTEVYLDPTAP
ncbi:MAG: cation diffusion facilitator family transporter [Thermoleophilia bacterium]